MTVESVPKLATKISSDTGIKAETTSSHTKLLPTPKGTLEPPTHYEYAILSALVYRPAEEQREKPREFKSRPESSDGYFRLQKWQALQQLDWFLFENRLKKGKEGFTAGVYINPRTRQVVIAFRGTVTGTKDIWESLWTLKTNHEGIVKGNFTKQQEEMALFVYGARNALEKAGYNTQPDPTLQHYQLSFTGHSLGAWLAEQAAHKFECPSVTFDSPGTRPVLERWKSRELTQQRDITTYLSKPNLINTCNEHHPWTLRELVMTVPPRDHWVKTWLAYTLDQHAIENIIKAFNPKTGMPNTYRDVVLWPTCGAELYKEMSQQFSDTFLSKVKEAFVESLIRGSSLSDMLWDVGLNTSFTLIDLLRVGYQAKAKEKYDKCLKYIEQLERQKSPGESKLESDLIEFYLHYYGQYHTKPTDDTRLHARHFHSEISHLLELINQKRPYLAISKTHLSSRC